MNTLSILIVGMTGTYLCIEGMPDDGHPMTRRHRRNLTLGIVLMVATIIAPL